MIPGDRPSGPDLGRILIGKASKSAIRPEGRFSGSPCHNPAEIWPGSTISGPEALSRNIGYPGLGVFPIVVEFASDPKFNPKPGVPGYTWKIRDPDVQYLME